MHRNLRLVAADGYLIPIALAEAVNSPADLATAQDLDLAEILGPPPPALTEAQKPAANAWTRLRFETRPPIVADQPRTQRLWRFRPPVTIGPFVLARHP